MIPTWKDTSVTVRIRDDGAPAESGTTIRFRQDDELPDDLSAVDKLARWIAQVWEVSNGNTSGL